MKEGGAGGADCCCGFRGKAVRRRSARQGGDCHRAVYPNALKEDGRALAIPLDPSGPPVHACWATQARGERQSNRAPTCARGKVRYQQEIVSWMTHFTPSSPPGEVKAPPLYPGNPADEPLCGGKRQALLLLLVGNSQRNHTTSGTPSTL